MSYLAKYQISEDALIWSELKRIIKEKGFSAAQERLAEIRAENKYKGGGSYERQYYRNQEVIKG